MAHDFYDNFDQVLQRRLESKRAGKIVKNLYRISKNRGVSMKTLYFSKDTFDNENKFRVAGVSGDVSLQKDYETKGDGIIWGLQNGIVIKSHYHESDYAHRERMNKYTPITDGEIVLIEGKQYRARIKGNFSDCVIFDEVKLYTLLDGIKQNELFPETFKIPSKYDIAKLQVGEHVKLCFQEEGKTSERMWVKLTKIDGDKFEGKLDNDPFNLESIECGDKVSFNSKHIISL